MTLDGSHSDENGEEESKGRWVSTDTMRTPPCAGHDKAAGLDTNATLFIEEKQFFLANP